MMMMIMIMIHGELPMTMAIHRSVPLRIDLPLGATEDRVCALPPWWSRLQRRFGMLSTKHAKHNTWDLQSENIWYLNHKKNRMFTTKTYFYSQF